jgi:hypothetical protein
MLCFQPLLFVLCFPSLCLAQTQQPVYDVCIYGATSAGVIAAYTAKKLGKSAVIVAPEHHPGGMSSGGLGQTDIGNKVAITGYSREFYRRVGKHYGKDEQWTFEPHVAEEVFNGFIQEVNTEVRYDFHLTAVNKKGMHIISIAVTNENSSIVTRIDAKMFIDCSYEGDLLAMAGVNYMVGREANSLYGETLNGVQLRDKHQFPDGIDPYLTPGQPASGLLWGISNTSLLKQGSGDRSVQAYNYRICLTNDSSNRVSITQPPDYDSTHYELLARQITKTTPDSLNWQLLHIARMPHHKTDINNCGGFSSDMIGMSYDYADATFEKRKEIVQMHKSYTLGWLYFLGHDRRVPMHLRREMLQWGYPKDEYVDNDHFTPQLYIREARRMIGPYVMTEHNCLGKEVVKDGIGLAAYTMDSHNCQRIVVNGMVKNEGDVQVGEFGPYPVSYRSIIPKRNECTNLFVPVCLSASHIAYGSIRMEPVFMVLAQSAATAAAMAIESKINVQDVDVVALRKKLELH